MNQEESIKNSKEYWNDVHKSLENLKLFYDNWLELFEKEIISSTLPIIDLGCGEGNNVLYLSEKGKNIIPCDYSENAIKNVQKRFPMINALCFDMTKGLPFKTNSSEIIIADLSLHYFNEKTTFEILNEIKRVLIPNGLLLFRVNSIKDTNHGAGQGLEIEHHLYENKGNFKRFFDKEDFNKFFYNWKTIYLNEEKMERYTKEKIVWRGAMKVTK